MYGTWKWKRVAHGDGETCMTHGEGNVYGEGTSNGTSRKKHVCHKKRTEGIHFYGLPAFNSQCS